LPELNPDDLKVLGLGPEADLQAVEKAFEVLARSHAAEQKEGTVTEESESRMKQASSAYSHLTGKNDVIQKKTQKEGGGWYVGVNRQSFQNFFYLFKLQFFGALIGVFLLSWFVYSMVTRPVYDFQITAWGSVNADSTNLRELVKTLVPEIKNPVYNETGVSANLGGNAAVIAIYTAAVSNAMLVDRTVYSIYAPKGYFLSLDDIAQQAGFNIKNPKVQKLILTSNNSADKLPHLYGVDVTGLSFMSGQAILTIPVNVQDAATAKLFMKAIMQSLK